MYVVEKNRKQLDVTADMLEQIRKIAATDVDADDIVVFEAAAFNTRPLNKRGSIFEGARASVEMLEEMVTKLNAGEDSVPLHTLHLQGSEIPVGKVFFAYLVQATDGETELRAQFYLPKTERELIEKINLGVLDEVSVGVRSQKMLCSKCGFDFMGEEADFVNLFSQTCDNDHTVGVDGTHVKLAGLDTWMELSLVSRGAANNPKILSRAKSHIPQETQDRIAASGHPVEATVLFASPTPNTEEKEPEPMPKETPAEVQEFDAQAAHTELLGKFDALIEVLTPAEEAPQVEASEEEEEGLELDALKAQIEDLTEKVAELSTPKVEDLQPDTPAGGVAASAVTDATNEPSPVSARAFKVRK